MSNQNVGQVYDAIIRDVLEASRVDFEESGIEGSMVGELEKLWKEKLTALNVASFPWDPKPVEPAAPPPAASPNPAATYTQATLSPNAQPSLAMPLPMPMPGAPQQGVKAEGGPNGDLGIKQEPGAQSGMPTLPAFQAGGPQNIAQQRAMQHIQNQYGQRATASIAQKQAPSGMGIPLPNPAQQQQRPQQPNGSVGASQVDGADDGQFEGVLMQKNADGSTSELGRVDVDRMLHDQIALRAKQMEGGGLMLPLKQASSKRSRKTAAAASSSTAASGPAQVDGPDDDLKDEDLEDAINSDLDDPEDENEESDDDDDAVGQQMLCLYDKVQRVKNKWKCTLKDGILTVNGREYVFHKATGEYEW